MTLNAWKGGLTPITADNMNAFLSLQDFSLIYEGTQMDAKGGSGTVENNIANNSYCSRFILSGSELSRVELELDRDNDGADLVLQIRSGMNPAAGIDGSLLKEVVVPKEFIPNPKGWWSIPIGLTVLSGSIFWLVVVRAGDSTNKIDWIGEANQDVNVPAFYRAGTSGAWTVNNSLHFKIFSGASGDLIHGVYGQNGYTTIVYTDEIISKVHRYLPPSDGPDGGIRDVITYSWSGEYLTKGVVT